MSVLDATALLLALILLICLCITTVVDEPRRAARVAVPHRTQARSVRRWP